MPAALRPFLYWGLVVVAFTFGALVEAGDLRVESFAPMLLRNFAILAGLAGTIATQRLIQKETGREGLAWLLAFPVLVVVGAIVDPMLG